MKPDLVIGLAANYDWPDIEPYAVSLVRSGFAGKKVLFAQRLTPLACQKLTELGFELLAFPKIDFSHPEVTAGSYFAYVGRFLLIHRYLQDFPDYRFVICSDTRDVILQHDPTKWLESHLTPYDGLVAASEHIRHCDQTGNTSWVKQDFQEVSPWLMEKPVYCSGVISGRAHYISDLAAAIYLMGRDISAKTWGADQPAYNAIMHQRAYADTTRVPSFSDAYCINLVVIAFEEYRRKLLETPPPVVGGIIYDPPDAPPRMWDYSLSDLSQFSIIHQYDRMRGLTQEIRKKYRLS